MMISSVASKMEIEACEKTVDEVDMVLMDGSLHSQLMTRQANLGSTGCKNNEKEEQCDFHCKNIKYKKTI